MIMRRPVRLFNKNSPPSASLPVRNLCAGGTSTLLAAVSSVFVPILRLKYSKSPLNDIF